MQRQPGRAALLAFALLLGAPAFAQDVPYGANDEAGHYLDVGDARIYYETYGEGPPLLLLHGGLYGYIEEYAPQIPVLSQHFEVIAVATRGHGRSEIGTRPYSYRLFADDAAAVLKHVTDEPAMVFGFSDGGRVAYILAAVHPESVVKVVAIGAPLTSSERENEWARQLTPESFQRDNAGFIASRKKLMPEPERWDEFILKLKAAYLAPDPLTDDEARRIRCPVLVVYGDKDDYNPPELFEHTRDVIPNERLVVVPGAGHVESLQRSGLMEEQFLPFLLASSR